MFGRISAKAADTRALFAYTIVYKQRSISTQHSFPAMTSPTEIMYERPRFIYSKWTLRPMLKSLMLVVIGGIGLVKISGGYSIGDGSNTDPARLDNIFNMTLGVKPRE